MGWDDPGSNPLGDVCRAMDSIRSRPYQPSTLIMSPALYVAFEREARYADDRMRLRRGWPGMVVSPLGHRIDQKAAQWRRKARNAHWRVKVALRVLRTGDTE